MPDSVSRTYRLSPHCGNAGSSGTGTASTVQPSGANRPVARSAPPRHGSAGIEISSGIAAAARSGRALHSPRIAVRNTWPSATASSDEAAYGRSLT